MAYTLHTTTDKFRLLISGFSNTGKTTCLSTFLYGPYDITDEDQYANALEYASGKSMVIIECPGEAGQRSLPDNTDQLTSYSNVVAEGEDSTTAAWSAEALDDFLALNIEVIKNKPDILVWDGLHWLYNHMLNRASDGEFLAGMDMDTNPQTGRTVQYRAAKFYNRARHTFGQALAALYSSPVPFVVATIWEKWEEVSTDSERPDINKTRYLWPDIPGEMATRVVGLFDARVSARLERRCLHKDCNEKDLHYVWQFLPKNDVMGVGIKGLKVTKSMRERPWIHQRYSDLKDLIDAFTA